MRSVCAVYRSARPRHEGSCELTISLPLPIAAVRPSGAAKPTPAAVSTALMYSVKFLT